MPPHGPQSSSHQHRAKRQRRSSCDTLANADSEASPDDTANSARAADGSTAAKVGQSSNFRNVSACNRCRLRKNRCDQKLPSCASCTKAGVACVGYDPITKKEIPRSYVFYLETRVLQLEKLLAANKIAIPHAENLELCARASADVPSPLSAAECGLTGQPLPNVPSRAHPLIDSLKVDKSPQSPALANIISPPRSRSLASASGVSFARVVVAAVQYSVSGQEETIDRTEGRKPSTSTSMRDSFFGLHTRPMIQPAPFPEKKEGSRLASLYFEHANPQIPVLHRVEFMQTFERAYEKSCRAGKASKGLTSRELYMINMVFAIGSGVILGEPVRTSALNNPNMSYGQSKDACQPEEYHASAIVHLEACLSTSGDYLEVLQAVLLLANFALLRPVPPGLWLVAQYITGVAVRLAVDLGLHREDGADAEAGLYDMSAGSHQNGEDGQGGQHDRGRRLWIRDLRRRLWWCTYTFDRLVSTCVGRPFGISDEVITTELPSLLDDEFITRNGFQEPAGGELWPSYKHVAHHYFRLRLIQSEILQVLQYNHAQISRAATGTHSRRYPEMRSHRPSVYLVPFDSFRSWRADIDSRLYQWKTSAPTCEETGVAFSTEFLELNYWQAIILLYRQSLSVPAMFEGEYNTSDEVNSPSAFTAELHEDEDRIYLKVAEAGQKILRIYRQLHLSGLVSYTYLSTHHLFMAGISYLYAIWHSPLVRTRLTMDEVDFTVLAAKSVFSDMIDKCPPAETCRDAFDRTAKATIKMVSSRGGFGAQQMPQQPRQKRHTRARGTANNQSTAQSFSRDDQNHRVGPPSKLDVAEVERPSPSDLPAAEEVVEFAAPFDRRRKTLFDADVSKGRTGTCRDRALSPSDQDEVSSLDPSLVPSSPVSRQNMVSGINGGSFLGEQFGLQGSMDYPDAQAMEFLHSLGTAPNNDVHGSDEASLEFAFDVNWDSVHSDGGDAQQMNNPFDTFFFGGQPGSVGGGSSSSNNENGTERTI